MPSDTSPLIGYVLKMYPRFSETFIVTEIIAREALGERLEIFALRPNDDTRFHAELARVQAPVRAVPVPRRLSSAWDGLRRAQTDARLTAAVARHLPELLSADADDALQAVEVARQALDRGVTHLHAHFASTATTVTRLAALLAGIPYSFTAHAKDIFHADVDPRDLERKLRDAAFAVTVSDFNLEHLRHRFPSSGSIERVYNGLDLARFPFVARRPRQGPLRLLAVGRLVEKKGFSLLIDAVERLRDEGRDATLDIVGDGELAPQLRAQAAGSPAIRFLGPLPQGEVSAHLRQADVFVAPCLVAADGNADGLPTVLLEAMASGVPCVSTAVTGIPEIIQDGRTGILCVPGDGDSLLAGLRRVARTDYPVEATTRRARGLIERDFDATRQAARLAALTAAVAADDRKRVA
ncbi:MULTISPECIES: glycosyltransferase [Microbacterium]|uniref:glycosyltransferase n=1 Tax=Microbacterium TaxID=33882 RepID=UPI00277E6E83|nr:MULTISPECIES: glycosyltransferase [Microbacterium]MDQ1082189.1 glycosyltransferase involved in cell wall biosynthesis [Microbacterium sp. SORGH_AS_0344]MDQ1169040.1 glycosyltransferase involved in cell wall biosynthesis [Microbacterium proteolyticum]